MTERQRILYSIEKMKKRGAFRFIYKNLARDAEANLTNVYKIIQSLKKQGEVKLIGGKGIIGDPYQFEIILKK